MSLGPKARLDLHAHSDRSDGRHPAEVVLTRAAAGGIDVFALTDHDLPPALPAGPMRVGLRTITLVHGVEISGMHEGRELHLLAYFPGEMPSDFVDFCRTRARARAERYAAAIDAMGLPGLAGPDAAARAGERALTRHHLARALVEAGHASSLGHAFSAWVGEPNPYVPPLDLSFVDAIARVRATGGYCSWAHPDPDQARAWAGLFAVAGLQALEAHRPGVGRMVRDGLARLAFKKGLGITGGSDWHGWYPGELGAFTVPLRQLDAFGRAVGIA